MGERGYNEAGQWVETEGDYQKAGYIKLPCGWYMWGDNDNMRSVGNCPIQGFGGSIISSIYFSAIQGSFVLELIGLASGINLTLAVFFGMFEGFLQAFVFAMLSLTYLSIALQTEGQ